MDVVLGVLDRATNTPKEQNAMALHHHTSTFPAILGTAEEIRAAAHAYNANYPEAAPLIDSGTPIVYILGDTLGALGKTVRVSVSPCIRITEGPDAGGLIDCGDHNVLVVKSFDGRLSPCEIGARLLRNHLKSVQVEIEYKRR